MRLLLAILTTLVVSSAGRTAPGRLPAEVIADSLYDAQAIESLFVFADGMVIHAQAAHDSVLLARMTYHRGRARLALRDPGAARDIDRALTIATAVNDSMGRMHALGLKAFVAVNQGRLDESIALNEQRIGLARALGRRGSEGWGHLLIGYAELYRENLERARSEYEEAWRAFGDANRPREQLTASIGLARALERMGHYNEARTSYQRAWLAARELGDRSQEADAINNLGGVELEHGELSLAADYFNRAFHIKRELKTFDIANAARNVALVDQMIGRYGHAESTLVDAMTMSTQGMLDIATSIELGRLRIARGRYAGAAACFREVLAQRATMPLKARIEAITYLSEALTGLDSIPAAVAAMDREFPALRRDPPSVWRAEAHLAWARCLRAQNGAMRAREVARIAWGDVEARRDSSLIVLVASELSLCERALGADARAYAWFERARRAFEASRGAGDFQWREARRAQLARALVESGDLLRVYPSTLSADERRRQHFDFLQVVVSRTLLERVTDPRRFGDIDPALAQPVTSAAIQADVLKPGECFLEVDAGADCIYVYALTRDELRAHVIDNTAGAVTARFRNYARLNARPRDARANVSLDAAATGLGDVLLGGVADLVRRATTIHAALDGSLAGAPFETLVCPGESGPLLASHDIVRIPCAGLLRYLRVRAVPAPVPSSLLAVASGTPVLEGARREVRHLASRYGAQRALDPPREEFFAGLAQFDAIHIASHVHVDSERPWHSGIQIGSGEARSLADGRRTSARATDPLALSPADSSEIAAGFPVDPFVRASEISNRRIAARLVVLSACESALGRAAFAEGVLGIASSFVSAGSRTVVASLWEVDDRTTAGLMKRFYRELESGKTVAAALRAAQLAWREKRPDPFLWAGFVVIGDGDVTVALRRAGPDLRPWSAALGGLTLMVSALWVVWHRRARRGRITP